MEVLKKEKVTKEAQNVETSLIEDFKNSNRVFDVVDNNCSNSPQPSSPQTGNLKVHHKFSEVR